LTLAQQAHDPALLLAAHGVLGATWSFLGAPTSARTHLTQGLTLYNPQPHRPYAFFYGPDGGTVLAEALTLTDTTGERWCEAELHRLKGALILQRSSDKHIGAEACFQKALDAVASQYAKSWELRAATSLARLGQHQGKRTEVRELLAPTYGRFTDGFGTADLQEARALVEALT
jgi:hypothetical protein